MDVDTLCTNFNRVTTRIPEEEWDLLNYTLQKTETYIEERKSLDMCLKNMNIGPSPLFEELYIIIGRYKKTFIDEMHNVSPDMLYIDEIQRNSELFMNRYIHGNIDLDTMICANNTLRYIKKSVLESN